MTGRFAMFLCGLLLMGCKAKPEDGGDGADTLKHARALAERGQTLWPTDKLYAGWIETVWGYGLHRLYLRGDTDVLDYERSWMLDEVGAFEGPNARAFDSSDSMSPSIVATLVMAEDPSTDLTPITNAADAYLAQARRTSDGAITHWGPQTAFDPGPQIWVDSQFMFGIYLLTSYQRTGEKKRLDSFVEQYVLFSDLCRDRKDQLYRHAYDDDTGENIPEDAVYWARGNSWVLIAGAELLMVAEPGSDAYETVLPLYQAHAEAMAATQAEDGLWRTVLNVPDDPANYTETSAAALIGYGLERGLQAGVLDEARFEPVVRAAADGVVARIDDSTGEPVLSGTSIGTNPGSYSYYVEVPTVDDLPLGYGAAVMFLAEVHGR